MMTNRVSVTFIVLLILTTLASGLLWRQGNVLLANQGTPQIVVWMLLEALVLAAGLTGLGRIAYRTAILVEETNE